MSILIRIHAAHRPHTNGLSLVPTNGRDIGECLRDLIRKHPEMQAVLFESGDPGMLRKIIEIYLNGAGTYPKRLATPVTAGDTIQIGLMLAGG